MLSLWTRFGCRDATRENFKIFFFFWRLRDRLISNAPESSGCVTRASSENRSPSVEHNTRPSEYRPVQGRLGYLLFLFKWDRPRRITTTVVRLIVSEDGRESNAFVGTRQKQKRIERNKRSIIVPGPTLSVVLHVVTPNDSSGPSRYPSAGHGLTTLVRTCRFWPSRIPLVHFLFSNKTKERAHFHRDRAFENVFVHSFSVRFCDVTTVLLKGQCFDRLSLSSEHFFSFSTRPIV